VAAANLKREVALVLVERYMRKALDRQPRAMGPIRRTADLHLTNIEWHDEPICEDRVTC
jgi:hypothetical protein